MPVAPAATIPLKQHSDNLGKAAQAHAAPKPGWHDEVGAAPFLAVRHLLGEDRGEPLLGRTRALQDACPLQEGRGADDDDRVAAPLAAAFEQERDVEHDQLLAQSRHPAAEAALVGAHQRMKDCFEPAQSALVAEDATAELAPVDAVFSGGPRERGLDKRHRRATRTEQAVNAGIGVMDRHAQPAKHIGGRALAHADRAREAQDDHLSDGPPTVLRTAWRNPDVTSGATPNHAAKPGRAWCSSMPSPSTTGLPRARAAARSGVSSGT